MSRALAVLALLAACTAAVPAQERPADPLVAQRRLAFVIRQATQHYDAGEFQAALDRLATLPEAALRDPVARNMRGAVLTKLGEYDEAERIFLSVLADDPDHFPASFNLAEVRYLRGDHEGALAAFNALRDRDPRNELLRFKVFLCLLRLGRADDARKAADGLIPAGSTPAWYFARAALSRADGDSRAADRHLGAARAIYGEGACRIFEESLATSDD